MSTEPMTIAARISLDSETRDKRAELPHLPLTDLGNAARLRKRYGHRFRHNTAMGWLCWDGQLWCPDDSEAQVQLAAASLYSLILDEAEEAKKAFLDATAKDLLKHGKKAQSVSQIHSALRLWQPQVFESAGAFDRHSRRVTVNGGVLDLDTREVTGYDPRLLCTRRMPVTYDPSATAPWFEATLAYFQPDQQVREYLQRWAGYLLTNDVGEQQFSIWYGKGANGKSTVLEALRLVLGAESDRGFALEADTRVFEPRRTGNGQSADPERFRMRGMKLVTAIESAAGFELDSAFVKAVTGGESMTARDLYRTSLTWKPTFKICFVSNHEPQITDDSEGLWRRVHRVNWNVRIPEEHKLQWEETVAALRAERSGILNWCLTGYDEWRKHGLAAPPQVTLASADMRLSQDKLGLFLKECTVEDPEGSIARPALWATFQEWRNGDAALSKIGRTQFYAEMTERIGVVNSYRNWSGLRLGVSTGLPGPGF